MLSVVVVPVPSTGVMNGLSFADSIAGSEWCLVCLAAGHHHRPVSRVVGDRFACNGVAVF